MVVKMVCYLIPFRLNKIQLSAFCGVIIDFLSKKTQQNIFPVGC